jgi:hypothetical protein
VNFPPAANVKLQRLGNVKIDHGAVGARIEQKFSGHLPAKPVIVPAPGAGNQRPDSLETLSGGFDCHAVCPVRHHAKLQTL